MSFIALYGLNVSITAATAANAGSIQIDPNAAAQIAIQLGANFTYASLSDGVNFEIIKITAVSGSFLVVNRGQDGTTSSAFPIGACIRFVWTAEGIAAVATDATITITGQGAAQVVEVADNNWVINVPIPTITGTSPVQVLGNYPAWEIALAVTNSGCCCIGGSGGGGSDVTITGNGLVNVTGTSPNFVVGVQPPAFVAGANMTITGSWPNITFASSGGGGGGGVLSVTGSPKIVISGSVANPVVNLVTTPAGPTTYNGISLDAWGTIIAVDGTYVPITTITSITPSLIFTTSGGSSSAQIQNATTAQAGIAQLAAPTSAGSNNPGDSTSIVTPAGVNAVISSLPAVNPVTVAISSNFTGDPPASYTNTLIGISVTVPALSSGASAIITAAASAADSATPGAVPTWGFGVFQAATLVQAVGAIPTGSHHIQFVMNGPMGSTTLSLKTTTLTGTTSVVSQSLSAVVLPG